MFTPGDRIPLEELHNRHTRCRELLKQHLPTAGGILVTGSPALYYMTGTTANGLAWLPLEGDMVLAVRKGLERAQMESPLPAIVSFRSYKELRSLFRDAGAPLPETFGVDRAGLSWDQGQMLLDRLPGHTLLAADKILARTRALKSEWELGKIRESCRRLFLGLQELTPRIRPGMSEFDIAREIWDIYLSLGHMGLAPTGMQGSAFMLGHICAGENCNYPSTYDGPVGIKGAHPGAPVMGHAGSIWQKGQLLIVDSGFNHEGYLSDKTQVYFAGTEADVTDEIRRAHEATVMIAEKTSAVLKPGAIPAEIYALSLQLAREAGYESTFMGTGESQVRFLGHGIGLTISEWPIVSRSETEALQAGMTIALEPKIALPGIGMVGVENTYEITENGAVSLTGDVNGIVCVG